jgi:hypothetical protein
MMSEFLKIAPKKLFEIFPEPVGRYSTASEQADPLVFLTSDGRPLRQRPRPDGRLWVRRRRGGGGYRSRRRWQKPLRKRAIQSSSPTELTFRRF